MNGMNGQPRLFHVHDILAHDITSALANAIGLVMEARHSSPADVPAALFDAARSLAAIEYKGNEIVRKLSDRAVIGDMPRSAAIGIINEGIAEGRKQPLRYATNQESPQCKGEPGPSRTKDLSSEVACTIAQAGSPEEKLAALESETLRLHASVVAGALDRSIAADALYDAANISGLLEKFGADTVQHISANGLDGRKSGLKPAAPQAPENVKANGAADAWNHPDWTLLDDRRGTLPGFPVDAFTPAWQDWLVRATHGAGVRPEHVAVPLLGVASSLIGTARRVRASRSWSEPMTLWACVVADSGDRKTPGLNVTVRALDLIEKSNSADTSKKRLTHETKVQKAKEIHKKWKDERQAALDAKPPKEPPPMPIDAIDPGNFIEPRLYVGDPTIEKLAPLLQARPRGMMLIRDELTGLFANMGRYSGGSDRPFWLEAWNGGRHVVERVERSIVVEHLLVGVVGSFQPDKLARAFTGDEDGMYGRFLYAWPLAPEYRPLTNEAAEVEPELQSALTALIRLPSEDEDGIFAPQAIWLSEDAIAEFEVFRRWADKEKRGLDGRERHWFVKGETVVLRLAGTLAYLAWSIALGTPSANGLDGITGSLEPKTIDKKFMSDAIRLWRDFFWPHARAAMRQIGLSDRHKNARRVLRWLKVNAGVGEISVKHIRRDALAQSLDAEQTEALLDGLANAGWLRRKPAEQTGGRPVHRWLVNPILYSDAESAESAESPSDRCTPADPLTLSALPALSAYASGHNGGGVGVP
jgi:hypothetical protein